MNKHYTFSFLILFTLFIFNNVQSQNLMWSAQVSNSSGDIIPWRSISDSAGNVYIIGSFTGTIQASPNIQSYGGSITGDCFLLKLDNKGNLKWINRIGSSNDDNVRGICISHDYKTIIVAGEFQGTAYFSNSYPASGPNLVSDGNYDSFLAKYDSSGILINHMKIVSGGGNQRVQDIKIDKNDNIYVAGFYATSATFSDGSNLSGSNTPSFIVKINSSGNYVWKKNITSTQTLPNNRIRSIDICNQNLFVAGNFVNNVTYDGSNTLSSGGTNADMYFFKLDIDGNLNYGRRIYGTYDDQMLSVSTDSLCNAYFSGYYTSDTMNIEESSGVISTITNFNNANYDLFYTKYDVNGNLQWFKHYGSTQQDAVNRSANGGGIFSVSGYFGSSIQVDTVDLNTSGGSDMLCIVYNNNDNPIYTFKIGGTGDEKGRATALDKYGNYFFVGDFKSTSLTVGSNTFTNSDGHSDMLIVKYAKGNLTKDKTDVKCKGESTGSIIVTPRGPLSFPFTYSWTKDGEAGYTNDNDTLLNLSAGTYRVHFTDGVGYTIDDFITIAEPSIKTEVSLASKQDPTCRNGSNGIININVITGTSDTSYVWYSENGSGLHINDQNQASLTAGTYSVYVTDANGCLDSLKNIDLTQPSSSVTINNAVVNPINGANPTGAVDITVSGGTPKVSGDPYNYSWTGPLGPAGTTEDLNLLATAGNYSVIVSDALGCTTDTTVLVSDTTLLYVNVISKTNVSCFGGSNGSISVGALKAKGNVTYKWLPGNMTTSTVSLLSAGTYTVIIKDDGRVAPNDTAFANITITQPSAALAVTMSANDAKCFGINNGSINLSVSGGTTPYSFAWKRNGSSYSTSEDISSLSPATYSYTVTDAKSCPATGSYIMPSPTKIDTVSSSVVPQTCNGGANNGSITINSVTGGTPYAGNKYYYDWSIGTDGQDVKSKTSLYPGNFNVTIKDAYNCASTFNFTIKAGPVIDGIKSWTNACYGSSNGSAKISPKFHSGRTYGSCLWYPNNKTDTVTTNLASGNYSVTVKDNLGCEQLFSGFNITQFPQVTITGTTTVCAGSNTILTGSGTPAGTNPWVSSNTGVATVNNGGVVHGVAGGTCNITYTNNTGCTAVASITVNSIPAITSSTPGSRCDAGTVTLGATASAGTLNWYSDATGGSSLGTGTNFITPSISSTTTYYVDATANSCTTPTRTAVIATVNTTPAITGSTPASRCDAGTVTLGAIASAGTINWYSDATGGSSLGTGISFITPSISSTSTYYIDATANSCTTPTRTAVIATVNTTPAITGSTPASRCDVGTLNLGATASAGTINWYSDATGGGSLGTGTSFITPSISSTTTYFVDASANSCATPTRTAVIATIKPTPTITGTTPASICDAGTVTLSATASAGTINWYSDATGGTSISTGTSFNTPNINTSTTYYVDATANSCTSPIRTAVIATVSTTSAPSASANQSFCTGSTVSNIVATPGTGEVVSWYSLASGGSAIQGTTVLTNGNYFAESRNTTTGCISANRTAVAISIKDLATITTNPQNVTTCNSQDASFNVTTSGSGLNYQWQLSTDNGSTWADQTDDGLYSGMTTSNMKITAATTTMNGYMYKCKVSGGCGSDIYSNAGKLTRPLDITANITTDSVYCFGTKTGQAVILATGGTGNLSYLWNDALNTNNSILDKVNAGDYICTVEDASGCKKNFNANISTLSAMTLVEDAANHTNAICNGTSTGSLGLKATGGSGMYEYSYNYSDWTSNVVFKDLAAGLYKFIMRDKMHPECVLNDTAKIQILEPNALVIKDLNISNTSDWSTKDGSIKLTAEGGPEGGYTFTLYPGDITNSTGSFTVSTGNYMISVSDVLGCDTISSDVTYVGPYKVDINNSKLTSLLKVYPNPSEGILAIQYFDPSAKSALIEIYNLQGAIIYKQEHFKKHNNFFVEKLDLRNKPKGVYIVKVNNTVFKDRIILK